MAGTLDPQSNNVKRKIAIEDVTGYTPTQLENYYNNNLGDKGWRIIQILEIGSNRFVLAEKEYE